VLHLQARVGLDEGKGQVGLCAQVHQELERAQAAVVGGAGQARRRFGQGLTQRRRQHGRGDLDHLLEPPLQGAVAVAQHDDIAAVAQHLDFHMPGPRQQAFGVEGADTEGAFGFGPAALPGLGQGGCVGDDPHAAAAPAGHRLEHDARFGIGRPLRLEEGLHRGQVGCRCPRQQGHSVAGRQGARTRLVAEDRQLLRRRADEAQPRGGAGLGRIRPLAEEAVARVQRIAAVGPRDADERLDVEVGGRPAPGHRRASLGQPGVRRVGVVGGMHGHRGNAHLVRGAQQAQRDLATVGDQQLLEHGDRVLPNPTADPCCLGDTVGTGAGRCTVRPRYVDCQDLSSHCRSNPMTQVSEAMTRGVRTLAPGESVMKAAQAMDELNVGAIPVCDGDRLVGMVTDRDIVLRAVAQGCASDSTPLSQVMSEHVRWCYEDDTVEDVAAKMRQTQIRRLPVVDREQHLVGIVSLGDLAAKGEDEHAEDILRDVSEPAEPDRSGQSAASGAAGGGAPAPQPGRAG
jgi:CBS domain-containing protein